MEDGSFSNMLSQVHSTLSASPNYSQQHDHSAENTILGRNDIPSTKHTDLASEIISDQHTAQNIHNLSASSMHEYTPFGKTNQSTAAQGQVDLNAEMVFLKTPRRLVHNQFNAAPGEVDVNSDMKIRRRMVHNKSTAAQGQADVNSDLTFLKSRRQSVHNQSIAATGQPDVNIDTPFLKTPRRPLSHQSTKAQGQTSLGND